MYKHFNLELSLYTSFCNQLMLYLDSFRSFHLHNVSFFGFSEVTLSFASKGQIDSCRRVLERTSFTWGNVTTGFFTYSKQWGGGLYGSYICIFLFWGLHPGCVLGINKIIPPSFPPKNTRRSCFLAFFTLRIVTMRHQVTEFPELFDIW